MQNFGKPLAIFLSKANAQVLFHFFFSLLLCSCLCVFVEQARKIRHTSQRSVAY